MTQEAISLNPQPAEPTPIDLKDNTTLTAPNPPSPWVAEQRSAKAAIGIPRLFPNQDEVQDQIIQGNEGAVRNQASSFITYEREMQRQNLITNVMASKQGQPLDENEKNAVNEYMKKEWVKQLGGVDPKTVFEENYANVFMQNIRKRGEEDTDIFKNMSPQEAEHFINSGRTVMSQQETLRILRDEAEDQLKKQGYPSWIWDRAKEWLIPGYWQIKLKGRVGGLVGSELEEQARQGFSRQNLNDFKVWASDNAAKYDNNPAMKLEWLSAMLGLSSSEKGMYNLLTFGDLAGQPIGAGTALKGLKMGAGALLGRNAVKTALEATFREPASKAATMEAAGGVREAATLDAGKQLLDREANKGNTVRNIMDNLPGIFNGAIDNIKNNPGRWRREAVERLMQRESETGAAVAQTAINQIKIDRIPALTAFENASRELADKIRGDYPELDNYTLNNSIRPPDKLTNQHYSDFYLGPNGDSLWSNPKTAENFAKKFLKGVQAVPEQQGTGWALRVSQPLQISDYVRDLMTSVEGAKTPTSWLNSLVGNFLTPEETLSKYQREARTVAAYGSSIWNKLAKNTTKELSQLSRYSSIPFTNKRQKWLDFKKVLQANEKEIDPRTGTRGLRYESPGEFEEGFMKAVGKQPDEQQLHAYFAWKRGQELVDTLDNLRAYRSRLHEGGQLVTITVGDPAKETARAIGVKNATFTGARQNKLPTSNDGLMIVNERLGDEQIKNAASFAKSNAGKILEEQMQKGEVQLYRVVDHLEQPLKDFSINTKEGFIKYVAIPKAQHKVEDLQWQVYPRRPPAYYYDHSIKQSIVRTDPITGKELYLGDKTISVNNIRALSAKEAETYDAIRQKIKAKDIAGAKLIHAESKLPQEFSEIHGWFKPTVTRGVGGRFQKIPSELSLDDPIVSLPRSKTTIETSKDLQTRYKKLDDVSYQGTARYLGQKYDPDDVFTLRNTGTAQNPLYAVKPVEYLNPITSLNRALNRVGSAQFLDDYKAFSISHWIEEAKDFLDVPLNRLRAAPSYYFHNVDVDKAGRTFWKGVTGDDALRVRNLKTANMQIRQFMGVSDPTASWLHSMAQKLSDSMYERGFTKTALATEWMLPKIKDPIQFLRSMTFHAKLGFFNPAQIWVQAQTMATTYAIAGPRMAVPGTKAALLYAWSRENRHPEIMAKLDQMAATKIIPGTREWKPGWWKEATEFMDDSGFMNLANEHAFRDEPWKNNIISGAGRSFLDAGTVFFRWGEKSSRAVAGYTSFLEWRTAHPTGAISDISKQEILKRADLLYANMSRASTSAFQRGILSVPTQFLAYQMRMAELAFGRRITAAERMRLFGTYAVMYGVPGAAGLTGLPIGDWIREKAVREGYNPGDDYVRTAIGEGIPSLLLGLIHGAATGKEEYFNVAERYGVNGFDPIREFLRSDKTFWDIFSGATGNTLVNAAVASHGFWKANWDLIKGEGRYPMRLDDLMEPFKEISTVNSAWKLYYAMNIAQSISKSGRILEDTSPLKSVLGFLTGLQPQSVTDSYVKYQIEGEDKRAQKYALDRFTTDYRRGILSVKNGNYTQADDYFRRARAWLESSNYPVDQYSSAYSQAVKGYEPMVDQGKWDFAYGRRIPEDEKAKRMKAFEEQQKLKYQGIK